MDATWVRLPREGAGVVIFVHGILSSGETCWKHENGAYWPTLLSEEPTLSDLGIYVHTYQTSIASGYYSVGDVADDLKERLKSAKAGDASIWQSGGPMFFVCHSMGGIVVRKLIVRNEVELIEVGARIGLFLVASPSLGSSYANWVATIARAVGHTQAIALKFGQDNQWLNDLDAEFQSLKERARIPMVGRELQEDKFIIRQLFGLLPQVVERFSANRYFGDPLKIARSDHFSISKPPDRTAIANLALVRFLNEDGARLAAITPRHLREIPGTTPTIAREPAESAPAPAPAPVADPADESGAAFVCVAERGSPGARTVKSFQEYCAAFGSPLPAEQSYSGFAVRGFFENGGALAVISRALGQGARSARVSIRTSPSSQGLVLSAMDVGAFGNRLQVEISSATRRGFRVRVREAPAIAGAPQVSLLEDFDNISVDGGSAVLRFIEYVNQRSSWIRASVSTEPLNDREEMPPPSGTWQLEHGTDGVITANALLGTGETVSDLGSRGGLAALEHALDIGLVCIPDLVQPWLAAKDRERVLAALLAHCKDRQAVAVLAAATSDDELLRVRAPCDSAIAIAVWPWISVASADARQAVIVPPVGHVGGAISSSDRRRGFHNPPSPSVLRGALGTAPEIAGTNDELAELALGADRRGINLLATVDGKPQAFLRPLITTALAEDDRDPARSRFLMFVVRRVRSGLSWLIFEPRSKEVERRICEQVDEFLHKLWTNGALGGSSPEEAYRLTVEESASHLSYELSLQLTLAPRNDIFTLILLLPSSDAF